MAMAVSYSSFCGKLVHETRNSVLSAYAPDTVGSLCALLSDAGADTFTASYWPYGEIFNQHGSNATPWGFVGTYGYYAGSSGTLPYVRTRHYDPSAGGWTSCDTLWPLAPTYGYSSSRPVSIIDPSGLQGHSLPPDQGWGHGVLGGLNYGQYCGPGVKKNPSWHVQPQDCIDACCEIHDRCLEAQYGAGLPDSGGHTCCDGVLFDCVLKKAASDCCLRSPYPTQCYHAQETILLAFSFLRLNPIQCNCVPPNLWVHFSQINWGGAGSCRDIRKPTWPYGCDSLHSGDPEATGGNETGGRIVGRKGGAPVFD